jgi:hypothetical protein
VKASHFFITDESIGGLHKEQHKKYDEYDNVLFYKSLSTNKAINHQYRKIIAMESACTKDAGDFKFPGKITVDQVSKTYSQ